MKIDHDGAIIELDKNESIEFGDDPRYRKFVLDKANDLSDETDRTVCIFGPAGVELGTYSAAIGAFKPNPDLAPAGQGEQEVTEYKSKICLEPTPVAQRCRRLGTACRCALPAGHLTPHRAACGQKWANKKARKRNALTKKVEG